MDDVCDVGSYLLLGILAKLCWLPYFNELAMLSFGLFCPSELSCPFF
jgi:hypothetical protein